MLLAWVRRADSTPRGHASGQRQTWIWFMRFLDGFYLHPVRSLEFCFPFLRLAFAHIDYLLYGLTPFANTRWQALHHLACWPE